MKSSTNFSQVKASIFPENRIWFYFFILICSSIFLQRFVINVAGFDIHISFIISSLQLGLMLKSGIICIDKTRLLLYLVTISALAFSTLMTREKVAVTSFVLMLFTYFWYIFEMPISKAKYIDILNIYQRVILVVACAGLIQFILQYFVKVPFLFSFEGIVPDYFLRSDFNTVIPIHSGTTLNKSNGFFLLEPSTFSQYLAMAIVIELLFFSYSYRLLVYFFGMLVSYSGTGLMLLGVFAPVVFLFNKRFDFLFALLFIGIAVLLFGDILNIDVFQQRATEFQSTRSSSFARFIGPIYLVEENVMQGIREFLFGMGAGSVQEYAAQADFLSHGTTWAKLLFEYGMLGFVGFLLFFFYTIFSNSFSLILGLAFSFKFFFLGGFLLNQVETMLLFILLALPMNGLKENRSMNAMVLSEGK